MRIAMTKVGRLTTRLLSPSQAVVVSIHDVSPRTFRACEEIVARLTEVGLRMCTLLVVPDHHHGGHFREDAELCAWLAGLEQAGYEVVIHGYYHQRERPARESLYDRIVTRIYTADEGEFYDLGREEALNLVEQALAEFREAGLSPEGFIAPAWLLSDGAQEALRDAGLQYTTRLREVLDLHSGRSYESQSLVWSTRSGWRRAMSLVWNRTLFRRLESNPLMRISIHPTDIAYPHVWAQIRTYVRQALVSRLPFTYERWIARQRTYVPARKEEP